MPSFHEYLGARLDARGLSDLARIDRLRDRVHDIVEQSHGGHELLTQQLLALGAEYPEAALDVLVFEPDFLSWQLWSVRYGALQIDYVARLDEDVVFAVIDVGSSERARRLAEQIEALGCEDVEPDDAEIRVPLRWPSADALRAGLALLAAELSDSIRIGTLIDGRPWLARISRGSVELREVAAELTEAADRERGEILRALWRENGGVIELGTNGLETLCQPAARAPLTTGHVKARLAALSELTNERSIEHVPALLAALESPENAGPELVPLRKRIYEAISWFDLPEVRAAIERGLRTEPQEVVDTIRYVSWRLE